MEVLGGVEVWLDAFLTPALNARHWSASRSGRFSPRERALCTHWVGGRVDPRVGLDAAMVNRKVTVPAGNRTSVVQPALSYPCPFL
jgi:hypothetical protein